MGAARRTCGEGVVGELAEDGVLGELQRHAEVWQLRRRRHRHEVAQAPSLEATRRQ